VVPFFMWGILKRGCAYEMKIPLRVIARPAKQTAAISSVKF